MYRSARAMALLAAVAGNVLFISVSSSAAAAAVVTPLDGAHAALGRHLLHPHPENLEDQPVDTNGDCGGPNQPVCDDRDFECDQGFVGDGGSCVPYVPHPGEGEDDVTDPDSTPATPSATATATATSGGTTSTSTSTTPGTSSTPAGTSASTPATGAAATATATPAAGSAAPSTPAAGSESGGFTSAFTPSPTGDSPSGSPSSPSTPSSPAGSSGSPSTSSTSQSPPGSPSTPNGPSGSPGEPSTPAAAIAAIATGASGSPSTPEGTSDTPDGSPSTTDSPSDSPSTPDGPSDTPDGSPSTSDGSPSTPDGTPSTPDGPSDAPSTPDGSPSTSDGDAGSSGPPSTPSEAVAAIATGASGPPSTASTPEGPSDGDSDSPSTAGTGTAPEPSTSDEPDEVEAGTGIPPPATDDAPEADSDTDTDSTPPAGATTPADAESDPDADAPAGTPAAATEEDEEDEATPAAAAGAAAAGAAGAAGAAAAAGASTPANATATPAAPAAAPAATAAATAPAAAAGAAAAANTTAAGAPAPATTADAAAAAATAPAPAAATAPAAASPADNGTDATGAPAAAGGVAAAPGPADSVSTRDFSIPDAAPIELTEDAAPDGAPEGATVRVMPDGTNQTVSAEGQPLGDAPDFDPIGPTGTTIDDNGIFVDSEGMPVDREGMPIDGEIDPSTGFITQELPDGTNVTLGPNGMKLPEDGILPPFLTVDADGVPRNASGEAPMPCGRSSSGCIGPPGSTITEFGIPLDPDGMPLLRDGSGPVPEATGINDEGFIVGDPAVAAAAAAAAPAPAATDADSPAGAPAGVTTGTRSLDGLLTPTGEQFPDDSSLPANVTVSTPDANPRDMATGDPVLDNAPGAYVNADGIYFNGAGEPINRDTGEPLPAGTTLDDEGYLVSGGAAAGAPDAATAGAPAAAGAVTAPVGSEGDGSNRIGPDGEPMPEDRALPVDQIVTPDRTPRMAADESPVGPKGTFANEDSVYVGPDGAPVDRSGEPILDADGNPTMLDAEGFVVDAAGNKYQPDGSDLPSDDSLPEGVVVGPDGVPRGADTNEPIGERGTRALPDGSLVDGSGEAVDQSVIDAANDPTAALQGDEAATGNPDVETSDREGGEGEGLSTGGKWGIGLAVAAAVLLCCCCAYLFAARRGKHSADTPRNAGALTPRAIARYGEVGQPLAEGSRDAPNASTRSYSAASADHHIEGVASVPPAGYRAEEYSYPAARSPRMAATGATSSAASRARGVLAGGGLAGVPARNREAIFAVPGMLGHRLRCECEGCMNARRKEAPHLFRETF